MAHAPILFSLHPQWADLVLSGDKTIEVRKRFARSSSYPALAFVYATGRVGGIVGSVRMTGANPVTRDTLAGPFAGASKIPTAALDAYLGTKDTALAIALERPCRLEHPIPLGDLRAMDVSPPQLFSWLRDPLLSTLLRAPVNQGEAIWRFAPVALASLADDHPIFDAPRRLYAPAFDTWLAKCKREDRPAYGVTVDGVLQGLAITAPRADGSIKLCMFHTMLQRAGLGTFLMDRVLAATHSHGHIAIYGEILRKGDPATRRFFTRAGFSTTLSLEKSCSERITLVF